MEIIILSYTVHLKSGINITYPFNLQLKLCFSWGSLVANSRKQFWQSKGNLLEGFWVAQRVNEKAGMQSAMDRNHVCLVV